jgi:hypothetical protein
LIDDLRLERPQDAQELALFLGGHVELVQRLDQVLDQGVEVRVGDPHALVRGLHVLAGIHTGTPGSLADLIDQVALQPRDIGLGEKTIDALVGRDIADEIVDDRGEGILAAQAVIEALLHHRLHAHVLAADEQPSHQDERKRELPKHCVHRVLLCLGFDSDFLGCTAIYVRDSPPDAGGKHPGAVLW